MCNCKVPHSVRDRRDKQKADTLNLLKAQVKQCLLPHMPTSANQRRPYFNVVPIYFQLTYKYEATCIICSKKVILTKAIFNTLDCMISATSIILEIVTSIFGSKLYLCS
jgi:hypothetical protein